MNNFSSMMEQIKNNVNDDDFEEISLEVLKEIASK